MSLISSVGGGVSPYQQVAQGKSAPVKPQPASVPQKDRDGDGDTDGPGVDVKG